MDLIWHGHSCFSLKTKNATIVFDPYDPKIGLDLPKLQADIVCVSHKHPDHNFVEGVKPRDKNFLLVDGPGEYEKAGVVIEGIAAYHDNEEGKKVGENTIYVIRAEEVSICHLGDLGHILTDGQLEKMDGVDVLLIPVGGPRSIKASEASEVINQIEPKIVIPMHYKLPGIKFDLAPVDDFIKLEGGTSKKKDFLSIKPNSLPTDETEIVILSRQPRRG
jgi:L-ascorbate metabolism protein UlaG (beta-lactamase superfamily)